MLKEFHSTKTTVKGVPLTSRFVWPATKLEQLAVPILRQLVCSHITLKTVQYLHPLLTTSSPLLFPNTVGNPVDHLSRKVVQFFSKYSLSLTTATEGRHAAATAAACSCTREERDALAKQMSHSTRTQELYYARTKS